MINTIMFVAKVNRDGVEFTHLLTESLFGRTTTATLREQKSYYYHDGSILLSEAIVKSPIHKKTIKILDEFGSTCIDKYGQIGLYLGYDDSGVSEEISSFISLSDYNKLLEFCDNSISFALSSHFYALILYHKAILTQINKSVLDECISFYKTSLELNTSTENYQNLLKILAKDPLIYIMAQRLGTPSVLHRVHELSSFFGPILNNSIYLLDQKLENILLNTKIKLQSSDILLPKNGTVIAFQKPILSFSGGGFNWDVYSVIVSKSSEKIMFCVLCRCSLSWDLHYFNVTTTNNDYMLCDTPEELISYPKSIFNFESAMKIINLSLCSVLYITNHPNCIKFIPEEDELREKSQRMRNIKKIDKLKKRIQNAVNYSYIYPSKSVDHYNEAINQRLSTAKTNPFRIIAGHFKNQPYGKQRLLRKYIWVKPYVRGKDNDLTIPESLNIKKIRT